MKKAMETEIIEIHIDPTTGGVIEQEALARAGRRIREGGLVAFPTETVYGLGGDALLPAAAKKIYAAKGRPSDNPLIVHIAEHEALEKIAEQIPDSAWRLAERFWPGPLTMILKKSGIVPMETTGGLETVAIREPNHPAALSLIRCGGGYIAAPSANASGRPSPTDASHVAEDLSGRIDMILDGGSVRLGLESTIVDLTAEVPTILRPGFVTKEMLETVVGEVWIDPGILTEDAKTAPKAPGMKYRHYAPKAELTLIEGSREQVIRRINELTARAEAQGQRVGIIATDENKASYPAGEVLIIGSRIHEVSVAQHLYGILRRFDELRVDCIYSESFPEEGIGRAIMNRLRKAAGQRVIRV